jgi:hypothetical protein
MPDVMALALREHGHNSVLTWVITGIVGLLVLGYRGYNAWRSRRRHGRRDGSM